MRFSVDAHALGRHLTGNEVYVRNLLSGFAALDHSAQFIAYLSSNVEGAVAAVPSRFVWRHVSANSFIRLGFDLARRVREDRPDLLHVQYTAPLRCSVPVITSVHDISFLEHPEYFTPARATQLKITVPRTMRRAARILTPSRFSRDSILRRYSIEPARVEVVPNGVSPDFRPVSRRSAADFVRKKYGIDGPFVLTVGDLQPRKNHIGLIRAFEMLLRDNPSLPQQLVVVGKNAWFAKRVHAAAQASPAAARIRFTSWVSDGDLIQFYNACDMSVFPSFYEGFGLPILEAMACGRAVACSNTSAMPEVADAAALLFDPRKPEEMAHAMRDLLLDSELRSRMERLGQSRAAQFTWERTASKTLEIYYAVAGAQAPAAVSPRTVPAVRQ